MTDEKRTERNRSELLRPLRDNCAVIFQSPHNISDDFFTETELSAYFIDRPSKDSCVFNQWGHLSRASLLACIETLFSCGRPACIAWLVISCTVGVSIQGHTVWAFTHVGQERSEVVTPAFAHCYASPSVLCVTSRVFVEAPLQCAPPRTIGSCQVAFAGAAVGNTVPREFRSSTATTKRMTGNEATCSDRSFLTAVTKTWPFERATLGVNGPSTDNDPTSKTVTDMYSAFHNALII